MTTPTTHHDNETRYAPLGERPEPYPDGIVPDPGRWSGRELVRVKLDDEAPHVLHDHVPPCTLAPPHPARPTARNATTNRHLPATSLPARRLRVLTAVTHDPGLLAVHGETIWGDAPVSTPAEGDGWTSGQGRVYEIPVGAVLVGVEREAGNGRYWRAWRVPPAGPPQLVFTARNLRGTEHLETLARLLDEDLVKAFEGTHAQYAASGAPEEKVRHLLAATERWRFTEAYAARERITADGGGKARVTAPQALTHNGPRARLVRRAT